jgi:glycerol-3-phosphate O-acyltransferase
MSILATPEQRLHAGRFINDLFKNEIFLAIEARMERAVYEEFLKAQTSEDRVRSWAKGVVIRNLRTEMQIVLDRGDEVALELANAEAKRQKKP